MILAALDHALVSGSGHRHDNPDQHNGTGWDLRATFQGQLPLGLDWPAERQALGQMQVIDDYAFVALNLAGFAILDVSDPALPQHVGVFDAGRSLLNDVEVTPDLRWAFVPSDRGVPAPPADPASINPAALVPDPLPGILIVDLADLSAPREAGIYVSPEAFGYHRLDLFDIDGSTYVFAATYSRGVQHPAGCRMDILRFDEGPLAPTLTKVGSYASPVAEHVMMCVQDETNGGAHDVFVTADPLEGFPLAVVSMWDAGVHLLDVSDPTNPRLIGYWDEMPWYNGERTPDNLRTGNAHEAQVTVIDGHRIVAVSMERIWSKAQGITWLIDFTEAAAPELVSDWQIPGLHRHIDNDSDPFAMTTHGPKIYDGRIWLTHHHAGLIVLNITTMDQVRAPEIEAWLLPPPVAERAWFGPWVASPMVYDVVVRGQDVFITDITSGFRVAKWAPGTGLWTESEMSP